MIKDHHFEPPVAGEKVAAIIVEPISSEGSCTVAPPDLLPALRDYCDEHGVLLIVNEIQTGMGRTGKMFCCEHFGVVPDILLLAEGPVGGTPFGAVIARKPIMHWFSGILESVPGGNPISCSAVLETIGLLEKHMISNVAKLHPIAMGKLGRIASEHTHISAPRGLGMLLAIDVIKNNRTRKPDTELRDRIVSEAFSRGLLVMRCGKGCIRFTPPLCINRVQLEVGLDVFDEAVATVSL